MATGCKPVAPWSYGGSNPPPSTRISYTVLEAVVAQLVERVLGKDEVTGSILVNGSIVLAAYNARPGSELCAPD